jgi:hypothetical protein
MSGSLCDTQASDCAVPAAHHGDSPPRSEAEAALAFLVCRAAAEHAARYPRVVAPTLVAGHGAHSAP